jgi:hypothetical protein
VKLYRPRMDDITDDELMADAVGDVAFCVLTLLANDPDRRNEFLRAFLALAAVYGGRGQGSCGAAVGL